MNITSISFPLNLNRISYMKNMDVTRKFIKNNNIYMAPKVWRKIDYNFLNTFQKELFGYSLAKSIQLILRLRNKSIKNSCIVIYDPIDYELYEGIMYICKLSKYVVFLTEDIYKASLIADYVIANYGISPIITKDKDFALNNCDFIFTSRDVEFNKSIPVWYFNNLYRPQKCNAITINDIEYKVPQLTNLREVSLELLGAILCQMDEKDVEKSIEYNGVILDKIKFNNNILCFKDLRS
ncbi:hypothetical protein BD780_003618 [Clostridium tetanomorphum]|uniref:Uncharacterized protein n=2 Tax=Clostridium tetanomorphum TaxID=1553 RepID=A0A923EB72_CLOTT|nr:hypothetical protein [Clostridium tetanomorphum]MBC2400037.1 hypothetical protein [Clostridium tetanomorphum]MBP1866485.1 hypothetical protein [Clostridium tetanomorphum]NRS86393.1 hypothetical protein [Clostridium tetanomorphum]